MRDVSFSTLQSDGFALIHYPKYLKGGMSTLVEGWDRFVRMPLNLKNLFEYHDTVGYEFKNGSSGNKDSKENLDVKLRKLRYLRDISIHRRMPTYIMPFIDNVGNVIGSQIARISAQIAYGAETDCGVEGVSKRILEGLDNWKLRMLHYPDIVIGEMSAPHLDKSLFTIHLHENMKGLQFLDRRGIWRDIHVGGDNLVVFAGMQMQFVTKGRIKAVCHRVISEGFPGRKSIVCFVNDGGVTPHYNKDKHGPANGFRPGFNYKMSDGEFRKLFAFDLVESN